eukprot:TRINITY_DN1864_c0_g1_i1.p2 TRINITY_DN1864_c0_g1~~TRINITY_DN1864_c0_g1_i1.p2  ORF type:complete len:112 (-),score=1.89 TRINITY_DN1864_c0_g1_i1:428-763(-)
MKRKEKQTKLKAQETTMRKNLSQKKKEEERKKSSQKRGCTFVSCTILVVFKCRATDYNDVIITSLQQSGCPTSGVQSLYYNQTCIGSPQIAATFETQEVIYIWDFQPWSRN